MTKTFRLSICGLIRELPLAHAMARRLKVNYVVARKGVKPYMVDQVIEGLEVEGDEEDQVLVFDGVDAKRIEGRNVCLVDDVV